MSDFKKDQISKYSDEYLMKLIKNKNLNNYIVIYSGRFQPFSIHHLNVYNHLVKKFGFNNVYIVTSNKVDLIKSPLNFEEKKQIIQKHNIQNVYKVKNPYVADEVLSNFDDMYTSVIYVTNEEEDRLNKSNYYLEYTGKLDYPYRKHAYVYKVPNQKIKVSAKEELSGTIVRKYLSDSNIDIEKKKEIFKNFLGFYDENIFNLLVNKFSSINESLQNFLNFYEIDLNDVFSNNPINEITRTEILYPDDGPGVFFGNFKSFKKSADKLAKKVGYDIIDYMTGGFFDEVDLYRDGMNVTDFPVGVSSDKINNKTIDKWLNKVKKLSLPIGYSYFEFLDYLNDLKINESSESDLIKHARFELKKSGFFDNNSDYNGALAPAVLELLKTFSNQNHSGFSGTMVSHLFNKLVNWENLTPLTSNPDEWEEVETSNSDKRMWQNKRNPLYFSFDRGKNYWNVDENYLNDVYYNVLFENAIIYNKNDNMLKEGGAFGHINHPFEDLNLTFLDIKNLIHLGLSGELGFELETTEKIDGQNIYITYIDGNVYAARNNKELKLPLNKDEIRDKFKHKPELANAFYFAMQDIENFISNFSQDDIDELFENGNYFINMEIYYPESKNVIDYDKAMLVFHNFINPFEYNTSSIISDKRDKFLNKIKNMITNVNKDIRNHFEIVPPVFLNTNKVENFDKKKDEYIKKLDEFVSTYNLNYTNTIFDYIYKKFENDIVLRLLNSYNVFIDEDLKKGIVEWLMNVKNKSINKSYIEKHVSNKNFTKSLFSINREEKFKEYIKPIEILILQLGKEILQHVNGFLNSENSEKVNKIKSDIVNAIYIIKNSNNIEDINLLTKNLEKINKIGGLDSIVPSEGLVFKYKGNLYKMTGAFAPVNQILGILKYKK